MLSRLRTVFQQSLKKYPVATNVSVYATFYSAAELSQQTFNKHYSPGNPDYNIPAACRIVAVGSLIYAPSLYFWYRLLDKKFVGTATKVVLTKVASDQFFMTPILLAAFYTSLGILEQQKDIFKELKEKYWKTFVANQTFWIPGQTINFYFVPPHLRVVYVASVSFIWINVLCYIKRQNTVTEQNVDL